MWRVYGGKDLCKGGFWVWSVKECCVLYYCMFRQVKNQSRDCTLHCCRVLEPVFCATSRSPRSISQCTPTWRSSQPTRTGTTTCGHSSSRQPSPVFNSFRRLFQWSCNMWLYEAVVMTFTCVWSVQGGPRKTLGLVWFLWGLVFGAVVYIFGFLVFIWVVVGLFCQ